jgi:hypothetical protein
MTKLSTSAEGSVNPLLFSAAVRCDRIMKVISREPQVTEAVPGIHRIEVDGVTVGYVVEAGTVFVSLVGSVYNTSCEVAQSLDLRTAVHRVIDA